MRVPVQLSPEDISIARDVAKKRNVNEDHFGPRTFTGMGSLEVHERGTFGEMMVARFYGVEPDLVVVPRGGGGTFDNVIFGRSVEIKTTTYFGKMRFGLMIPEHTYKGADIYIQVCANLDTGYGVLVGWAPFALVDRVTPRYPDDNPQKYPLTRIIPESRLRTCRRPNQLHKFKEDSLASR